MKVLLTGSEGFIGSHLTEKLVLEGHSVRALVQYNSFSSIGWLANISSKVLDEIEIIHGDIRDPFAMENAVSGCDAVLHLAALIAIPYSYIAPRDYVETNVMGTLNVLMASRKANVSSFLHTSTSEIYGSAQYVPIDENHPQVGQSPYSASKIGADQIAISFYKSFDFPVKIIRPFNTYGPRQSNRAVIPAIITQLANNQTNLKLGSLRPTRDFSYVEDTVDGFIAALQSSGGIGKATNLGSNFEISIADTVKIIAQTMDKEFTIEKDDNRMRPANSEVDRLWADNSKAKETFGWQPNYAGEPGFRQGIKRTVEWFTNAENLKNYNHRLYTK
jgi:NAD dependent epimerase/dehydratase